MIEDLDPRPLLLRSAEHVAEVVRSLTPAELDGPTPCPEYDVRTLAAHVLGVLRRVTAIARGEDALALPRIATVPDDELADAVSAEAARVAEVWTADDAVLDRVVTLPFGTGPGRAAALMFTQELTVHAWDLATAVGRAGALDVTLAAAAAPVARRLVPAEVRGGPVPFGPVVEVPADAGPYALLVGWLGRDPSWTPSR